MRVSILLLLTFLYFSGNAQFTLSGRLIHRQDNAPISGATITLSGTGRSTTSDANGGYLFNGLASGRVIIIISHIGYNQKINTLRLTGDTVLNLSLDPAEKLLQDVQVTGNAKAGYRIEEAGAGPLGRLSLKDIPYSINVTSGELIENRNAHTLADALQTNPTATVLMVSNTYSSLSRMMIRGFPAADQGELRDGLVDRSFTLPPIENVEKIEVLNGLSSFLYGFSAVGGTINYVSKQPTASPLASFSVGRYGGGINYLHADLGGRVDTAGRLGYRFNVYRENGDTYIKGGNQGRTLISGALDYRLSANTHLTADIYQQSYKVSGLQSYFALSATHPAVPKAFDESRQYGQSWTYNESDKTLMGIGIESKIDKTFSVRAAWRYGTMWRKYNYIAATLPDSTGKYQETWWDTPRQNEETHSSYLLADASITTGPLLHHITFGYTATSYLYQRGVDIHSLLGASDIFSPAYFDIPSYAGAITTFQVQSLANYLVGDRLELTKSWTALLGMNAASVTQRAGGIATSISSANYSQHRITPGFGLVFKPVYSFSAYASYMQGLNAGGTAPATAANANQQLSPSAASQYEVGVKTTIGILDLTGALFRINQVNELIDPADNIYQQEGREVHQGLEITATGKLTPRLLFVGGGTLLKARMTRVANNPAIENKIPLNVPQQQARAYLEYGLPGLNGFTLSAGLNYYGKRPVTATNTVFMPAVTTADAGLRYQLPVARHALLIAVNVSNLANKRYWLNYRNGDGLQLGTPRMLALSAKFRL